jgi:hypothetical protein
MGQSTNISHVVAFFISFQDIVTLKLPFGANRGYWWFKKLITGNSLTDFRQKSAVFAPKWTHKMHKLCLSHHSWIFMIFTTGKRVIMSNTNYNDLIIHFFPIFGDFSIKSYDFAPKYLHNAQWAKVQTCLIL